MIAEACRDMIMIACQAPFQRYRGNESAVAHTSFMKDKWTIFGARFEYIISNNSSSNKKHLVGDSLTYADILVAHVLTWFVEEVSRQMMNTPSLHR